MTTCYSFLFDRLEFRALNYTLAKSNVMHRFRALSTISVRSNLRKSVTASDSSTMINPITTRMITQRHATFKFLCLTQTMSQTHCCHSIVQKRIGLAGMLAVRHEDLCRWYTSETDEKKAFITQSTLKQRNLIHGVIKERKERFQERKDRLKESSQVLLKDLKKTKDEMKERMEVVIEKENIYTIPNFLTLSRIILSPYLGLLVVQMDYKMALGIFTYAAITDLMDGLIARRFPSQQSKIGSFLDPMADKVLIATLFLSLTYVDLIPVALTGMIITRDLLLVGAGFIIRYQSLPSPKTFSRYFDATHATAQLQPTLISKGNTIVQLTLVASTLAAPVFNYVDHPALHALWYFTAFTTAASALSYIITKNTYKFIKKKD